MNFSLICNIVHRCFKKLILGYWSVVKLVLTLFDGLISSIVLSLSLLFSLEFFSIWHILHTEHHEDTHTDHNSHWWLQNFSRIEWSSDIKVLLLSLWLSNQESIWVRDSFFNTGGNVIVVKTNLWVAVVAHLHEVLKILESSEFVDLTLPYLMYLFSIVIWYSPSWTPWLFRS